MSRKRTRRVGTLALMAACSAAILVAAPGALARVDSVQTVSATPTFVIWTDRDREADIKSLAEAWARPRGLTVQVIAKAEQNNIRSDFVTVQAANAPDVITGAHDWVGELASNGSILPLSPRQTVLKQIPKYTRDAFSYGKTVSQLYGMPTHVENVGLFVNTQLAKVPKNWADLEKQALAFKRKGGGRVGIDVQQGTGGDAYHMYPFFSGLCGYVFGKTKGGALNPKDVGLDNKVFMRNAPMIDRWNKLGLVNSKIDGNTASQLFTSKKAAFWVTGPWNIDTVRKAGIKFRIVQLPRIKCASVPFLGVGGMMVSRFARTHGLESAAKDFVASYMASAAAQNTLTVKNGRYPANTLAAKNVKDVALRQIGQAGAGGVPMPNIKEMASVWNDLGLAWVKSTRGAGATKAQPSFKAAARAIRQKIAQG
ncbi:MAG TPA: extracellular solute-binding protein [Gaiellaceae bacterium]|nr:extracellular solute-binding protein [Gaiellaceae bacterium]